MKIVIVGPGATGLLLASFLTKIKQDVWLLDKDEERADHLEHKGIKIEGLSGQWEANVKSTCEPKNIGKADLLVMAVKSYSTQEAAEKAKSLVGDDTLVLTLQNGLGNLEVLEEVFGAEKIVGGVTNLGSTLIGVGHIKHAGEGETVIGMSGGRMGVGLRQIREIFNKSGLDCKITKDINAAIWSKLIINVGINPLSAIIRLPNGKLFKNEFIAHLVRDAVKEATKVAKRKRVRLVYDDPISKVESICKSTADNISSMLQDVANKRRTEIDSINGAIVRHAQTLGISTPVNSLLVDLIKTIEATYSDQI